MAALHVGVRDAVILPRWPCWSLTVAPAEYERSGGCLDHLMLTQSAYSYKSPTGTGSKHDRCPWVALGGLKQATENGDHLPLRHARERLNHIAYRKATEKLPDDCCLEGRFRASHCVETLSTQNLGDVFFGLFCLIARFDVFSVFFRFLGHDVLKFRSFVVVSVALRHAAPGQ